MKKIVKYNVPGTGSFILRLPRGSQVLGIQPKIPKNISPVLWVLTPFIDDGTVIVRHFTVITTGQEVVDNCEYVGSFQCFDRQQKVIEFHMFEVGLAAHMVV